MKLSQVNLLESVGEDEYRKLWNEKSDVFMKTSEDNTQIILKGSSNVIHPFLKLTKCEEIIPLAREEILAIMKSETKYTIIGNKEGEKIALLSKCKKNTNEYYHANIIKAYMLGKDILNLDVYGGGRTKYENDKLRIYGSSGTLEIMKIQANTLIWKKQLSDHKTQQ